MTPELREACRRAVHVVTTDGRVLRAGRASLFVLGQTGYPRLARLLSVPPLVWIVETRLRPGRQEQVAGLEALPPVNLTPGDARGRPEGLRYILAGLSPAGGLLR